MPDNKQGDHPSARPHVRVRIWSDETEAVAIRPHSLDNPSGEKMVHPNASDARSMTTAASPAKSAPSWSFYKLPSNLQWVAANWNWSKWKPVLRSALAAWICLLLFLIPATLNVMGQAAFLIMIAAFLSPPSDPFVAVLQREIGILTFAAAGWAWSSLGIKLAYIARSYKDPTPSPANIFSGYYLEPAPTVIIAVFLFIGSFIFLYLKSRMGPGPLTFACIFGCICIDISLTAAVLFPYPYYTIGQYVLVPLAFHSAVSLALSLTLFPTSASAVFTMRLQDVLSSMVSATKEHYCCLQRDVTAPDFSATPITTAVNKTEGRLAMLGVAARLQKVDVIYSRFAPTDYAELHSITRRLIARAIGLSTYYALIDPTREKFPATPVPSIPATPIHSSPPHSRHPSPARDSDQPLASADTANSPEPTDGRMKKHTSHHHHSTRQAHHHTGVHHHHKRRYMPHVSSHHSTRSHSSLLHFALTRATRMESAVGVFESLHYLNLEATHKSHSDSEAHVKRATDLLNASCQDLLKNCEDGLQGVCDWLGSVHDNRFNFWVRREEKLLMRTKRIKKYENLHHELSLTLDEFINKKRLIVLDPYRSLFTVTDDMMTEQSEVTPHRHLFHSYVFQFHLMRFATSVQDMLSEIIRLETKRGAPKLWFPRFQWSKLVHHTPWEPSENVDKDDDENPDIIPGLDPTSLMDLGQAVWRDPDALPPRNILEKTMNWVYYTAKEIGGGNVLYALKAGILTILLMLPSFLESSAAYAYKNKAVWAVIMGQLTLARFRGDTTFGLLTRIFSTLVGGIIGVVIWYIASGSGQGNAIGLAAVCFVCFPLFFFFHLYWPVPPMTNLIIWVTAALVYGYSYQDTHLATTSSPGYGFDVAWKRFVLVTIGVVAAGIFSFFPPSTTIRLYQRKTLATTSVEIGSIYCSVISFANTKKEGETAVILLSILAILSKLQRSLVLKQNIVYEFSLRGKWPTERYQRILELQTQLSKLLSHLTSVLELMEPAWAHAFLKRTRLSDADFQGDVLAVMSLISSSLRTGNPLPQVTPCPLLHRFIERDQGLNVVHEESEEDFGLPKVLTEETLESLQYLIFCVGVSTACGIVTRLDKLMVAVKELVGEQYHIDGVGLPLYHHRGRKEVAHSRASMTVPVSSA